MKIPKDITHLQIEISLDLHRQLKRYAAEQDVTLKYLVLTALGHAYPQFKKQASQDLKERSWQMLDPR